MSGWTSECRLLLVDDEPMILMDLQFAAEERGCEILSATSADDALELLTNNDHIRGAVLDVNLGGGETCVAVARELDRRKIAYILHSGDLNRQNELVGQLGAVLVPKPADARHVIELAIETAGGECVH